MRILFIPLYFFYKLLPFIVLIIITYESCYNPDLDRIKFDRYKEEAISLSRAGVPAPILIYREIDNEVGLFYLLDHYPQLRFKKEEVWIKELKLTKKQALTILKYKSWLTQN